MKILFLAPQPFFQERGTPIAVDLMLSSLSERRDEVDVLTFHLGENRRYDGVNIMRISPPFAPASVNPGFSWKKVYCDLFLLYRAFRAVRAGRYDIVHAVEEGVFIAMLLNAFFRIPYVYDMDSSMVAQLLYRFRWLRVGQRPLRYLETLAMRRALAVVPMCESLAERARQHCRGIVQVVSDASLIPSGSIPNAENIRTLLDTTGPILLYVGNLERYQGLDLLLDCFVRVHRTRPDAELVIIGGTPPDIDKYRRKARALNVAQRVHLLGPRPLAALGGYLRQADLLISPRVEGDNTPLKIYSYLDSGVAVVATDVPAHTQLVGTKEVALAAAEASAMAAAINRLLDDPLERQALTRNARNLIGRRHTLELFCKDVDRVFGELEAKVTGGA
ncbi:MAG: glycosyltransferase family 4 protein [Woeseia sp.]